MDLVVGLAGGDVDGRIADAQGQAAAGRRRRGEIKTNTKTNQLRLARRLEVELQDQLGARLEGPGRAPS